MEPLDFNEPAQLAVNLSPAGVDAKGQFTGYAAVWNVVDAWGRKFTPVSFDGVLARMKAAGVYPPVLWEHNKELVIGRQVLTADPHGLRVEGQLFIADENGILALDDAKKAYNLIKTSVYGMSVRAPFDWANTSIDPADGTTIIHQFDDIRETTITSSPACNIATVEAVASARGWHAMNKAMNEMLAKFA